MNVSELSYVVKAGINRPVFTTKEGYIFVESWFFTHSCVAMTHENPLCKHLLTKKFLKGGFDCILKRTGEFLEAVCQRGKVTRGCNSSRKHSFDSVNCARTYHMAILQVELRAEMQV